MIRSVRLCLPAGLSFSAAMVTAQACAADSLAQGCPTWLGWACGDATASKRGTRAEAKTIVKRARKLKQVAATEGAAAETPKTAKALNPARGVRADKPQQMTDEQKRLLFQEFLEWQKARAQDGGTSR